MYRRFKKDFSKISLPLSDYLRKYKQSDWLDTMTVALNAIDIFKSKLVKPSMLALAQQYRTCIIKIDASAMALRASLLDQKIDRNMN